MTKNIANSDGSPIFTLYDSENEKEFQQELTTKKIACQNFKNSSIFEENWEKTQKIKNSNLRNLKKYTLLKDKLIQLNEKVRYTDHDEFKKQLENILKKTKEIKGKLPINNFSDLYASRYKQKLMCSISTILENFKSKNIDDKNIKNFSEQFFKEFFKTKTSKEKLQYYILCFNFIHLDFDSDIKETIYPSQKETFFIDADFDKNEKINIRNFLNHWANKFLNNKFSIKQNDQDMKFKDFCNILSTLDDNTTTDKERIENALIIILFLFDKCPKGSLLLLQEAYNFVINGKADFITEDFKSNFSKEEKNKYLEKIFHIYVQLSKKYLFEQDNFNKEKIFFYSNKTVIRDAFKNNCIKTSTSLSSSAIKIVNHQISDNKIKIKLLFYILQQSKFIKNLYYNKQSQLKEIFKILQNIIDTTYSYKEKILDDYTLNTVNKDLYENYKKLIKTIYNIFHDKKTIRILLTELSKNQDPNGVLQKALTIYFIKLILMDDKSTKKISINNTNLTKTIKKCSSLNTKEKKQIKKIDIFNTTTKVANIFSKISSEVHFNQIIDETTISEYIKKVLKSNKQQVNFNQDDKITTAFNLFPHQSSIITLQEKIKKLANLMFLYPIRYDEKFQLIVQQILNKKEEQNCLSKILGLFSTNNFEKKLQNSVLRFCYLQTNNSKKTKEFCQNFKNPQKKYNFAKKIIERYVKKQNENKLNSPKKIIQKCNEILNIFNDYHQTKLKLFLIKKILEKINFSSDQKFLEEIKKILKNIIKDAIKKKDETKIEYEKLKKFCEKNCINFEDLF